MTTKTFDLHVAPDSQGRTTVTLTDPHGEKREPVILTLHGERSLYQLMQHVRVDDLDAGMGMIDVLDTWKRTGMRLKVSATLSVGGTPPAISAADVESAIDQVGF